MVALPVIPGLSWDPPSPPEGDSVDSWLRDASARYSVPQDVLRGVLSHESSLDVESARRPDFGNGGGLAQAIETTARQYGTSQAELRANPRRAVDVAAQILRDNAAMFGGDYQKAAAAYFVGPGTVQEAEQDPSGDWLGAADRIAVERYNQGRVSDYLAAAGVGGPSGSSAPSAGGMIGNSVLETLPSARAAGGLAPVSNQPGYLYDLTSRAPAADVNGLTAGQGEPGTMGIKEVMRRAGLDGTDYGSKITGALTSELPGAGMLKDAIATGFNASVPGTRGLLKPGNLVPAFGLINQAASGIREVAGLAGVDTPSGGDVIAAQLPATPLDIGLSAPPGTLARGAGLLKGLARGGPATEAGLSIIGDAASVARRARQARAQYEALRAAGQSEDEILSMLGPDALNLAKGTTATVRGVEAATELTGQAQAQAARNVYERALEATGDPGMATDVARNAAGAEAGVTKRLRQTAQQMSERMGPGVVDSAGTAAGATDGVFTGAVERTITGEVAPDKLRFTLQPEDVTAGQAARSGLRDIPTSEFPPIAGVTESNGTVTVLDGQTRAMLARERGENVAVNTLTRPEYDALSSKFDMVELSFAAHRAAGVSPEDLRQIYKAFPTLTERGERAFKELETIRASSTLSRTAATAERTITGEVAPQTAEEIAARLADEADRIAREGVTPASSDTLAGLATAAKRLGDPASEIRRQLQQGDTAQPGSVAVVGANQQQLPLEIDGNVSKRQWKLLDEALGVLGLPRTLTTSLDVGGIMRNNAILGAGNPRAWATAARKQAEAFVSEDAARAAQAAVESSPAYPILKDRGWKTYDWGADAVSRVPERSGENASRVATAVGNLPGFAGSERSLALGRNVLSLQVLEGYVNDFQKAVKSGVMTPAEFDKRLGGVIDVVNHANGFSGTKAAKAISGVGVLFSPEFTISRFQVVADPLVQALQGNTEARNLALKNLGSFMTTNALMLSLLGVTGGTGRWSVNGNPLDGDFGQLRIGNTRFDTLAGFGPMMKTIARMGNDVSNGDALKLVQDLARYFENKESPLIKAFTDAWVHDKLPDADAAKNMIMPMLVSGLWDSLKAGENPFIAFGAAAASAVGIGTNTYQTARDYKEETARSLGLGQSYNDLDPVQRLKVLANLPEAAGRNAATPERQAYDKALTAAGYLTAPETETASEKQKRERINVDVIVSNPELDVQRWFFSNKTGGALQSPAAVDQALGLALEGRVVRFQGNDRDLNASEADRQFWAKYGKTVNEIENVIAADPKNLEAFAQFKYKKAFSDLKPTEQDAVQTAIREGAKRNPKVEAVMIFAGQEKPNKNGEYTASSQAVVEELKKLWAEFPGAQSLPRKETASGAKTKLLVARP